jgi:hypothetical protein
MSSGRGELGLPGKGDSDLPGESSEGSNLDPGKCPEDSMTPEGEEAGQNEAPEKDNKDLDVGRESKSPACAGGHCCGRRKARRVIISQYSGDN